MSDAHRLARLAYQLGRAPLLHCLPRDRDRIHRIHAPNDWGGLQRFARKRTEWLSLPVLGPIRPDAFTSCTAGGGIDYVITL